MAFRVYLDDIEITDDLNKQYPLPQIPADGIYPTIGRNAYYDLLPCIWAHEELKENFFNNKDALHNLTVVDDSNTEITMRLLLSMKYTSRNR